MNNQFTRLFKIYGWNVEELDENSFIASNDSYFVPFSYVSWADDQNVCIAAVSYHISVKDALIDAWRNYNQGCQIPAPIGYFAYINYVNNPRPNQKFIPAGIADHEFDIYEIEHWLSGVK